jgi:hypothetical protein
MIILRKSGRAPAAICPQSVAILLPVLVLAGIGQASAQIVESVGSRALGMGGAFVGLANDSSATWWNPAGLAAGPFFEMAIGRAVTDSDEAGRDRVSWVALGTLPGGFSYYRLRLTEAGPPDSIGPGGGVREEGQGTVPLRSLSASQFGITLVRTLLPGVHAGATFKYLRGTLRSLSTESLAAADSLDRGEDLEGGDTEHKFDLDLGVFAVGGPVSAGAVVRNVRRPTFGGDPALGGYRLPRQVRVGAAFDGDRIGSVPLTVSLDADVQRYSTASGDRRVVAIGAEQWVVRKLLAVRAGGRFNAVGAEERAATVGVTVVVRSRFYLDGHVVRGGAIGERGWGLAARVSL